MAPDEPGNEPALGSSLPEKGIDWIVRFFGAVAGALILFALALTIYSIVQRYVFNTPLKWGDELAGYVLVALVMSGMADALRRGDHISIDLVTSRIGPRARRLVDRLSTIAVLAFSVVLGISAWESIVFAHAFGSYSPGYLEVATWITQLPILIGAVVLGLTALALLYRQLRKAARGNTAR